MLKTTRSSIASAFRVDNNKIIGSRVAISWSDMSRKLTKFKSQIKIGHLDNSNDFKEFKFLTLKAKKAFNRLRQTYTKALILWHFDPECHIRIGIDVSSYIIKRVLS